MKKVKSVKFLPFTWILVGLLNLCSCASAVVPVPDPISVVINKCDPDSFNSMAEVETFNMAFGYYYGNWDLNLTFIISSNRLQNRCKVKTVNFKFSSTSKSEANSTSVSTPEKETITLVVKPEFWSHGFFNYTPTFFINRENYCVKKMSWEILTIEICEPASTSNPDSKSNSTGSNFPPTLQKCCPIENVIRLKAERGNVSCKFSENLPWKPKFEGTTEIYPNYNLSLSCDSVNQILPHQLASKIQRDKTSSFVFKNVRVLENGQVEIQESGNHKWRKLELNNYCVDGFYYNFTGDQINDVAPVERFMVLQCPSKPSESGKIKDIIYTVISFISSFVLLIIVVAYVLTWNQQNIHAWTKCAFSLAMFLWLFCTGVRHVYKEDDGFCVFIAVSTHFFRIAAYAWMLVMNFDIWSTISSLTSVSPRSKGHKRFMFFCCVTLAIPTLVVVISLIIENRFNLFDDSVIRPQYGRERCYLDHTALKTYNVYPTLILFLPNSIFIFLNLKIVLDLKKGRKRLQGQNSNITAAQNNNNKEMKLCLKLFVIMGVSWIFDIISGLTDTDEVSWYWMITDIYNIAQSFLLFWLFIYKRTIREQLSEKYSLFKAGFKWVDVHVPRFLTAESTGADYGQSESQSQSQATRSSTLTTPDGNSTQLVLFNPTLDIQQ